MGRSYQYECPKCGYKARVSGRADDGLNFSVQTILCRDCKELHDAVVRLRVAEDLAARMRNSFRQFQRPASSRPARFSTKPAPKFEAALNRLRYNGIRNAQWITYRIGCPVSPYHRVRAWNEPDHCPRCGLYLERSALPFRIWD